MTHSDVQMNTREMWRQFCRSLEQAGDLIAGVEAASGPLDQAEGYRYLTRLLRIALEMNLEWADKDFPGFYQASHTTAKIGADNPDNHYLNASISPERTYVITGKLGTCPILTFGSKANRYAIDGTMASTGELALEDMLVGDQGEFEIIVSRDKPEGRVNWLPMADDSSFIVVRQTFRDRPNETAHEMSIRALNGPATPEPLSVETLAMGLERSVGFISGTVKTFLAWAELFRAEQYNKLETSDQSMFLRAGGDPMIHYLHGYWKLEADEALVIEVTPPECVTWNFQVDNYWMESLDYRFARIHVNDFTAAPNEDGSVTVVLAAKDPGFGNWLNSLGHNHGTMLWRWTGASEHPLPKCKIVRI